MKHSAPHRRVKTSTRRQAGATLLEAIAYLGIAGVIVVGAVSMLTRAFGSAASNRAIEQYEAIHTNVKKLYSSQPDYLGMNEPAMLAAGVYPTTLRITSPNGPILNGWGGRIFVGPAVVNGIFGNGFAIAFTAVPQDACIELVSSFTANHWGAVATQAFGPVGGAALPVTPAAALLACPAAVGNTVTATSLN